MEKSIWDEFERNPEQLVLKAEELISKLHDGAAKSAGTPDGPASTERVSLIKQRIGQTFFRTAVLNSYHNTCCVSGTNDARLLEACHIVDWCLDSRNRTNPSNGLCLNVFFHKSFDHYLIGITPDYGIEISDQLVETTANEDFRRFLRNLHGGKICLPDKFLPHRDFLAMHYDKYKASR